MGDDTIPLKKNKTQLQMNQATDRSNEPKKSMVSQNEMNRESVKSKRSLQTVEEFIAAQFGMQFTELVLLLSAEQQAEVNQDEGLQSQSQVQDRKMILKRSKRF